MSASSELTNNSGNCLPGRIHVATAAGVCIFCEQEGLAPGVSINNNLEQRNTNSSEQAHG